MKLLLVVVWLVAVNAVPLKRSDYDSVMSLVEHAYEHSVAQPHYVGTNVGTFGKRDVRSFFSDLGQQLSATFASLGHAFQDTFQGLAQTAAQQGTDLLSTALQGGAQVVANGANTLATNLQQPQTVAQKRSVHDFFSNLGQQLSATFTNLGHAFQDTFQGLAQTAAQQGTDLLSTALQGGAQVVASGATNLAANLQAAQTAAQRRDAVDFLTELQHQLAQLSEHLQPFVHQLIDPME